MNRTYKSVYNESTGTFVAVAENVKAKGKRSSSRVKTTMAGLVAAVAAGALVGGSALAAVNTDLQGNSITFTDDPGIIEFEKAGSKINFSNGGSITGLTSLMVGTVKAGNTTVDGSGIVITGGPDGSVNITNTGLTIGTSGPSITGAPGFDS